MPVEVSTVPKIKINPSDYIQEVSWNGDCTERQSDFDKYFRTKWGDAMKKGYFKYTLGDLKTRVIRGKINYILQLNEKRATDRRKPQPMTNVSQPFNPELFNFTKIRNEEILFKVEHDAASLGKNSHSATSLADGEKCNEKTEVDHLWIINVAPYEYGTSLLVPDIQSGLPQVLTADALCLSVKALLLSKHPGLRFGFNSLCAYASVNHLHMHAYYIEHSLYIETCEAQHLSGPIYECNVVAVKAFVFSVPSVNGTDNEESCIDQTTKSVAEKIVQVTDYLRDTHTPFNVMVTRGRPLDASHEKMSAVRIFVWPRSFQHLGEEFSEAFNLAFVELSGHIPVKTEEWFKKMDEQFIERVFQKAALSDEKFAEVRSEVIRIGQA